MARDKVAATDDLPVDPGVAQESPFAHARRSPWPRLRPDVITAVFVGGCIGGLARHAATTAWPASVDQFPWSTFTVNVAGSFILALIIVVAAEVTPSRYLRPLVGTGFCGALTTFSSVVVATSQLVAHHRLPTAAAYLLATIVAGLLAALLGLVVGRALAVTRLRASMERGSQ